MQIHQIGNAKKSRKRVGRGGKKGTYSGKGMKGQRSRAGYSRRATFEGGSTGIVALTKKLRGFKALGRGNQVVSLEKIERKFEAGEMVNPQSLKSKGMIRNAKMGIKILSDGEITKKLSFENVSVSKTAEEKIKKAGGEIKIVAKKGKAEKKEAHK